MITPRAATGTWATISNMAPRYQEFAPEARLEPYIECFWALQETAGDSVHRVLPDGCSDILFSSNAGIRISGVMTQFRDVALPPDGFVFGVRFHPGMAHLFLPVAARELTDQLIKLPQPEIAERLAAARSSQESVRILGSRLAQKRSQGPVQEMASFLRACNGQMTVDDLAARSGFSARHLRRIFLEQTGLTPKQLCRILRFRHASANVQRVRRGDWVRFALDHGYYDQAHLVNEFRELSGRSPSAFVAEISKTSPPASVRLVP